MPKLRPSSILALCFFLLLLALLLLPAFALRAATGDVQFGVVGSSGALTSQLVTPGTPPAVFGIATDGGLKSFSLGTGLTITGGTITASGGSWADLAGVPAVITSLENLSNAAGVLSNNGTGTLSWGQVTNAQLAGSIATSKLSVSADVKTVLDAADFAAIQTALSLTPGTDVQAQSARLQTLADGFGLVFSPPGFVRWTGTTYDISSSTIGPVQGGTGISIYDVGDMLYASAFGTLAKLGGNTTTTRKVLTSTGNMLGNATAPAWSVPNIAVGTDTTTGAGAGDILTSDGTNVSKLTPGTGVATWLATPTVANLSTVLGKAVVTSTPSAGISWSSSDVFGLLATISGFYGDIHIRQDGMASFIVDRDIVATDAGLGMSAASGTKGGRFYAGPTAQSVFMRFGSNAQWFAVAGTYASDVNFSAIVLDAKTESGVARIGSDVGSSGGTPMEVEIIRGGQTRAVATAAGFAIGSDGTPHSVMKSGVVTLSSGTATVAETAVLDTGNIDTTSRIWVQRMNASGTVSASYNITRGAGEGFTIQGWNGDNTASTEDNSTLVWLLVNP